SSGPSRQNRACHPAPASSCRSTRSGARARSSGRALHEGNAIEALTKDFLRVDAEMRRQDLLIDGAEVDRVREVAELVELREVRRLSVEAALHAVADEEDRRGGPVVGPAARVLFWASTELGPSRDHHAVGHAVR